jgi:UDP-3-O-[3-hydroxymyristoyl] glucosamine N-acyltransferase
MSTNLSLELIIKTLGDDVLEVIGPSDRTISLPVAIHQADRESQITFCKKRGEQGAALVRETKAGVIFCPEDEMIRAISQEGKTLIIVNDPRLSFLRVVDKFFTLPKPQGIHPSAVIHAEAAIDSSAYIGPLSYVGKSQVGAGSVIYGHVHIYDNVRIGDNVTIHAGTVIGADGFGYQRNEEGELEKFPHIGGVVIEDDVEIGANTCIDRGTLGDTILRANAKIDNLVHIAHNVEVGRHTVVIANAMIAGSVKIGDYSWVAPSVSTREGITIGSHSTVGLGALAAKDIASNMVVMGAPARPAEEYKRLLEQFKELLDR